MKKVRDNYSLKSVKLRGRQFRDLRDEISKIMHKLGDCE